MRASLRVHDQPEIPSTITLKRASTIAEIGISGFEAVKALREDPTTCHIPVLAVSANAMPLDVVKGLSAGFFRYLTKPLKIKEFLDVLDMALLFSLKTNRSTNE